MVVNCVTEGCGKRAGFNEKGNNTPRYCKSHATSTMVNVVYNKCRYTNCNTTANYNLIGLKAEFCGKHKTESMINVTRKLCNFQGCNISPSFNLPGEKKGLYCIKHKLPAMVNVLYTPCLHDGCSVYPTFNSLGSKKGIYCVTHKLDNMINVADRTCNEEGCMIRPTYGFICAEYCANHKKEGMTVHTSDLCQYAGCKTRAIYNYEIGQKALYCSKHKLDGMINIKDKHCMHDGCMRIPSFNMQGTKRGLYCSMHKKAGMVNVRERTCKTELCMTQVNDKYEGYCLNCFIHLFPEKPVARNYKTKEKAVREFICSTFSQNQWLIDRPLDNAFSKRRPDLLLDLSSHVLIVETDENQHLQYDCTCQNKRIMELSLDIQHRPLLFIRFNPDKYYDICGNKINGCWKLDGNGLLRVHKEDVSSWQFRLNTLKDTISYWINNKPSKTVETVQLFYDQN
jgi:hypothetical protein